MSSENNKNIITRFAGGIRGFFSQLSASPSEDLEAKWDHKIRSNDEPRLFLVLANSSPDKASNDWERENVVTNIYAMEAQERDGDLVVQNCEIHLRALHQFTEEKDIPAFIAAKPGQWIECSGEVGGPLQEIFFTNAIKMRDDLKSVAPENMPNVDDVQGVLEQALFGAAEPQTLNFKM